MYWFKKRKLVSFVKNKSFNLKPYLLKKRIPILYFLFLVIVYACWVFYVQEIDLIALYKERWPTALTMLFGAFVAGSSPEGSAAIAYPVFTLLLKISPDVARNFAFAIQSIGMTAASLLILGLKIKVEWNYIKYVTFGGVFGLVFGTYYVVPYIAPVTAKLFFVSLWLSFGIVLWLENRKPNREVFDEIVNINADDKKRLMFFGFIGGIISSLFGTGINIFTYCLMTVYYKVSEKVATPSSVIIMTIETILGFFLHKALINDFQPEAFQIWIACIPIVVISAPFGAFVISKINRKAIATILYLILIVQFIGAMWVIKPSFIQLLMCLVVVCFGFGIFRYLAKARLKTLEN